ncbi:hypothetical protein HUJ04_010823 [Dendroctonus ponderosae]|nr:hypothetical protein HUJ04_010823 [Dendroctonus ponderosae]KAH1027321.1 hypothetical protein HUJ05_000851 [Dendroctonus ponderosae]
MPKNTISGLYLARSVMRNTIVSSPRTKGQKINDKQLSRAKSEYISKLLLDENIDMAIIQETHIETEDQQRQGAAEHLDSTEFTLNSLKTLECG